MKVKRLAIKKETLVKLENIDNNMFNASGVRGGQSHACSNGCYSDKCYTT